MGQNDIKNGALYAGFSYLLWGILPIYWKLIHHVNSDEILANRILWSFIFMIFILVVSRKWAPFLQTLKGLKANKKQAAALVLASILISCNWFVYIWAVNADRMIEASLGYYINPLVSVLLGMLVFKERLGIMQYISFILALAGVLILSISYGQVPWASLLLAFSFGFYGLAKKLITVEPAIGLTLETLVVAPFALIYLVILYSNQSLALFHLSAGTDLLLLGAGIATAIPLLLFAKGAQKIPLSMLGFLQYIAPTITLILGVFVYGEAFSSVHLLAFLFIWSALTVYSLSKTKLYVHWQEKRKERKKIAL
ncbi:EamA family transporter RarD [Cytobacillus gottheilii]|uniref:EamA family transporter RarD n=1 Tax=Cytobacillus gottheilii TaxID=859144 RepID=UPI0009B94546|nr:EamA family transporter RarD [Cytobacillus gottheilii]